ncbi:hypothetical protein F511_32622 [Dorcoceras hygrometricum]|uniref:Uncharacterized protein n=1 Tax=Dorcoceras hygrometricum TaxID=472368 RepID=A0A2Z7C241_9LAMI|nr:hypothetical protein F511_32622 [Dorcoceras hygrometricum]
MCSSQPSANRPASTTVNVGGFILWNLANTSSISPNLSSHIIHLYLSSASAQRYLLLLNILITARGSRLPIYLPSNPTPTSPRRHLPKLRGATTQSTITRKCGIQARRLSRPPHQNSVGPFRSDDSSGRSQRAKEFSSQRNQAQYIGVNAHQTHA